MFRFLLILVKHEWYIDIMKKSKYFKDNIYICECGRQFFKAQSLNAHFGHCELHANIYRNAHNRDYNHPKRGIMNGWGNKTKDELDTIHKKSGKTLSDNIKSGITSAAWTNKHHSEDTKEKLRSAALENISNKFGGIQANFSVKACNYIDKLNIIKKWNLQHALSGGEMRIGNYFVDGYDPINKIIFEYDEKKHYYDVDKNILKERDIKRQNKILEILGNEWHLYRYNEKIDFLYKVF